MGPTIYAYEVGQGDCHLILHEHEAIIIDAGPADSSVAEFISRYGYRIKQLILTHNDADHSTGAMRLLSEFGRSGRIEAFGSVQDRPSDKRALRAISYAMELASKNLLHMWRLEERDGPVKVASISEGFDLWLLYPRYADNLEAIGQYDKSAKGPNKSSAVLRLSDQSGAGLAVWSGDLDCRSWEALTDRYNCDARWFVVPHHGSSSGWKEDSIRKVTTAVKPQWAVFTVGTDNQYSHPSLDWIEGIQNEGGRILCTQITPKCHENVEALGQGVLSRDFSLSSNKMKGVACGGTLIYQPAHNRVLRLGELDAGISSLNNPMCKSK